LALDALRLSEPSRAQHSIEELSNCIARFTGLVFLDYSPSMNFWGHPPYEEEVSRFGDICPTLEGCYFGELSFYV
jgi:hypothetical protein